MLLRMMAIMLLEMAINESTTNNDPNDDAPNNAPNNAPNDAPNDAPKNVSASTNNVSISGNVVAAPLNVPPNVVPGHHRDDLAPPNGEDPFPAVDVVIPPALINAPTVENPPTNVVVKMEQVESEQRSGDCSQ